VKLWDLTVTLLLVLIELGVLVVIAAPRWVARRLRAGLDRLLAAIRRALGQVHSIQHNVQTSREER
jgi:uncharacterized membrane protein